MNEVALYIIDNGEMIQTARLPLTGENEYLALQEQTLQISMGNKSWVVYFNKINNEKGT